MADRRGSRDVSFYAVEVLAAQKDFFGDWLIDTTGTEEGVNMRILLMWICVLGITAEFGAAQQEVKQVRRRFEPPSVVTAVEAVYPLQSVVSGTVVLEVSLDDAGKVTDIRVVRGIASLTEPAERSVRQWTFQAAKLNGKPVSSKIVVAFSFVAPNVGPRV